MREDYPETIDIPPTLQQKFRTVKQISSGNFTDPSFEELKQKEIRLGPKTKKLTLVLDIDNTILYSAPLEIDIAGNIISYDIALRPHLQRFLEDMTKKFEILLFTAGSEPYAEKVWNLIDPNHVYITNALGCASCIKTEEGHYVKDLRIFADRDPREIVLIDDRKYSFAYQPYNGILINTFEGQIDDKELIFLAELLEQISQYEDVRIAIKEKIFTM